MVCPISNSFVLRKDSSSKLRRNVGQIFSFPPEQEDSRCDTMRDIISSKDVAGSHAQIIGWDVDDDDDFSLRIVLFAMDINDLMIGGLIEVLLY